MVLDACLLNTQHKSYGSKGKWSNLGKGVAPSPHLGVVAIEKGAFRLFSTMVSQLIYIYIYAHVG